MKNSNTKVRLMPKQRCRFCKGTGFRSYTVIKAGYITQEDSTCDKCGGKGTL
jgi:DnaJ-class molecular chaperone